MCEITFISVAEKIARLLGCFTAFNDYAEQRCRLNQYWHVALLIILITSYSAACHMTFYNTYAPLPVVMQELIGFFVKVLPLEGCWF